MSRAKGSVQVSGSVAQLAAQAKRAEKARKRGKPDEPDDEAANFASAQALARRYAAMTIRELAKVAQTSGSDSAKVAAGREILERAFGKTPTIFTGDVAAPVEVKVRWLGEK